ncbi:MAG: UDP-N-acetylmuramate dehydrogenase [Candidatus Competibacteraceae bacterium]|jgi:UDP-N-acetylmuramate dehydrogenase|nr:UDP-N-acetylmuramate dehydrogenase [Candidatus Competibacteraceae bacterium]
MMAIQDSPQSVVHSPVRSHEPLAGYTSWRVGGPADRFFQAADVQDLAVFLSQLPQEEPLFWLGLGSNLLVRDGGIRGTVIATHGALTGLTLLEPHTVRAEAGVPCAKVARFSARHDLCGVEFLAGIPGVIGGALAMNAGAWGGEIWPWIKAVETIDRQGVIRRRTPEHYAIAYRQVQGPLDEWFTAALLQLNPGDGTASMARIRELLEQRSRTQPTGVASCGSVFRNPPGDHAARLIETAGLKGLQLGGACVSTKHANFIVNTGKASAFDLERLITKVAETVERIHGVRLTPEVRIVGEFAAAHEVRDDEI